MSTMFLERRTRGFAMVTAIFILVVLAMLGAFIASIASQSQVGSALDIQGARAYQAARAGLEWGLCQALGTSAGGCTGAASACGNAAVNVAVPAISGMNVSVACQTVATGSATEAGLGTLYKISAWACNIPDAAGLCPGNAAGFGYVERRIDILAESCPAGGAPPC